ncbi:MAG: type II toxin-antitoxin system VapC family toxin, partial [Candidatus Hydrothermarchaeaceae archaeon]
MEHIGVLIDSDILIEHLRGNQETTAKIRFMEEEGEYLYTTPINSFELYYGAYKSKKVEKNIRAVDELLKRLMLLPL